jgi:hypothetical protein
MGRTLSCVNGIANRLKLHKDAEYKAAVQRNRNVKLSGSGVPYRFKPGRVPANKGKKMPGWAPGRMAETQFKKGERSLAAEKNWHPIGTIHADSEGFMRVKIREHEPGEPTGWGNRHVWEYVHKRVWVAAKGAVPKGHVIAFKDGKRSNVAIENLECISRRELLRRNCIHNLPKELVSVIRLAGVLNRKLRQHGKEQAE